jgi:hypothetical protein
MLKDFPLSSFNQTHQVGVLTPTNIVASVVPTNMKLNFVKSVESFPIYIHKKQKKSMLIF